MEIHIYNAIFMGQLFMKWPALKTFAFGIFLSVLLSVSLVQAQSPAAIADSAGTQNPKATAVESSEQSPADTSAADSSFRTYLDNSFTWAAFVLTHKALKNSKSLHNWLFFPLAAPIAWNTNFRLEKDFGKLLTLKGLAGGNASIMDFGLNLDATLEIMHLLELGISGNVHSSINYQDAATFMGVYNPEIRDFDNDIFMTEFAYGVKYRVGATIPLIAFLPRSNWTKIILRPNASWTYTAYTGADVGEIWKAGAEYSVNGFRYSYGGTLIYMLPFPSIPMLMVNVNTGTFFKSAKIDEVYDDYDPYFKTVNIMPMLNIVISEKWSSMLIANFSRDRKYEKYRFEPAEELLQKRVGSEWGMKVIMMTFTRRF